MTIISATSQTSPTASAVITDTAIVPHRAYLPLVNRPLDHLAIAEGATCYPINNSWLTVFLALTTSDDVPVGDLRVVGDHIPSGTHWVSEASCSDYCKISGVSGNVKFGNLTFEPPAYETGIWQLKIVDNTGRQLSEIIDLSVDPNEPMWYFVALRTK